MKKIVLNALFALLAAMLTTGCSKFVDEDGVFAAYNRSADHVVAIVNGVDQLELAPSGNAQFKVQLLVPSNPVNSAGGPSAIDKQVEVSVAFRNVKTGDLTMPITCSAGAKIVTTIYYNGGSSPYASCTSSY